MLLSVVYELKSCMLAFMYVEQVLVKLFCIK
jgi:hypothetical protein